MSRENPPFLPDQKTVQQEFILENRDLQPETRPTLEFQEGERECWDDLADKVVEKIRSGEPVAVSLVRCWNKDAAALETFADRFDETKKHFPELEASMISINGIQGKGDKDHMTTQSVAHAREQKHLSAVTVEVNNYTWTAGLNGPAALLFRLLTERGVLPDELKKIYILNQSFDVEMSSETSQRLSASVKKGDYVLTIREEDGKYAADESARRELGEKIKEAMRTPDLLSEATFLEELARAGRNTGMIVPLSDIVEIGGFSNVCNAIGGMEDHDMYMRLLLKELHQVINGKGPSDRLKKILRAFADPIVYNDPAWNSMAPEPKEKKKQAEGSAMKNIAIRLQQLQTSAQTSVDYSTPLKERDFNFGMASYEEFE